MLGNKAQNIIKIQELGFNTPFTLIIKYEDIRDYDYQKKLSNSKNYIIRPSFDIEDAPNNSYAGYFNSIYPLNKNNVIQTLHSDQLLSLLNAQNNILCSIIIQEYVVTDIYGVMFTRNPINILLKGYYELSDTNDGVTSGKILDSNSLTFMQKIELENTGKKLEKAFKYPQDIEFCIKNNELIILQSRPITTGNKTIYSFEELANYSGIYKKLDFDELGYSSDYFSYHVLSKIFNCMYIDSKIYFKKSIFPNYLFKNFDTIENYNLRLFLVNYQLYLRKKLVFSFFKFFSIQKLDKKVLQSFFSNYSYSFIQVKKSNLDISFDYETNNLTKYFLKIEFLKHKSFKYLELYKKEYDGKKSYEEKNYTFADTFIILNGKILKKVENKENYIYKGKIKGYLTKLKNVKTNNTEQVLFIEDLDIEFYEYLPYISGIIIKNGNLLSHNSILIREYKIPSIIRYEKYNDLIEGEYISI